VSIYRDIFKWADRKGESESPVDLEKSEDTTLHPLPETIPRHLANDLQVFQENIEALKAQSSFKTILVTASVRGEGSSTVVAIPHLWFFARV